MPRNEAADLEGVLRTALHGRAATLTPLADPFPGVERRARGLRRRRAAASVAGTAFAVAVVAGAVPLLTPDREVAPGPSEVATSAPSPSTAPASAFALDLDNPWPYRGDRAVLDDHLPTWQRDWSALRPGAELVPLFGQVWEPSGRPEVVFVTRAADRDQVEYGVASTSESGSTFVVVDRSGPLTSFPVVLPADEGGQRLLLVADPDVGRLQYAADGERFGDLARLAPGVATVGIAPRLDGAADLFQVVGPAGELVETGAVADESARPVPEAPAPAPGNLLGWGPRGTEVDPEVVSRAQDLLAANRTDVAPGDVEGAVLFSGDDDAGRRYLLGQFWVPGDKAAETIAIVVDADGNVEPQLYRVLGRGADVAAMYLSPVNEQSLGELVVVPRPGTGQVLYAGDDGSEWVPKDTPGLDGVVLLSRNPAAERGQAVDRLRLLDGDGVPFAEAIVADLLCGRTSCG